MVGDRSPGASSGARDRRAAPGVYWNLRTTGCYYTHALRRGEGVLAHGGPLVVDTGKHTGRSAEDKFVVREPASEERIWWGKVNQPLEEERFDGLRAKVAAYLGGRELYVVDAFAGADPEHRIAVRIVTASAVSRALRADDVPRGRREQELARFDRMRSSCTRRASRPIPERGRRRAAARSIVLHPAGTEVLVGGTYYAGEIKKSIFTLLNDRLPLEGVFPMHCSANVGDDGDVAIFFGLSGTGKDDTLGGSARGS